MVTRAGGAGLRRLARVAGSACSEDGCVYAASGKRDTPLQVVDLDADGEPEVLVDAYTGGAHCCALTEILRFDGDDLRAGRGLLGQHRLRAEGPRRRRAPGVRHRRRRVLLRLQLVRGLVPPAARCSTTTSTAKGSFSDVTRRFPALARKNAKDALHALARARRGHFETLGAVSAYVADLYLLGRGREVRPYLARARKRGDLRNATGRAPRGFDRQLLAFLHKQGYR